VGDEFSMFVEDDGALVFKFNGWPVKFRQHRPWQPVQRHGEMMDASEINIGRHGARGEMDDLIEFYGRKKFVERGAVGEVAVAKFKGLGERLDFAKVAALDLRVVEIVQVVEGPDAVAVAEEAFANVRADETRAAGDEKIHGQKLTIRTWIVEKGRGCLINHYLTTPFRWLLFKFISHSAIQPM